MEFGIWVRMGILERELLAECCGVLGNSNFGVVECDGISYLSRRLD